MAGQPLETKFFVPSKRRGVVPRARLRERLDRITDVKVTLVAAPAGFGKTTLLADWLAGMPAENALIAWLSLDQANDDPASFWTYVIGALQTALPEIGASALALLQASQPPPVETVLTTLLNHLAAIDGDIVLVLDDFHLIESQHIHTGM